MTGTGGGWARQDKEGPEPLGPFTTDMPPPGGVFISDLPGPRPAVERPHVKGVPPASTDADEDHQPGGGTWQPA